MFFHKKEKDLILKSKDNLPFTELEDSFYIPEDLKDIVVILKAKVSEENEKIVYKYFFIYSPSNLTTEQLFYIGSLKKECSDFCKDNDFDLVFYKTERNIIEQVLADRIIESKNSVQKEFEGFLIQAVKLKASDIYITSKELDSKIEVKYNKKLKTLSNLSATQALIMIRSLYTDSVEDGKNDQGFDELKEQSAIVYKKISGKTYILRFQTIPQFPSGLECILRIIELDKSKTDKEYNPENPFVPFGFSEYNQKILKDALSKPSGVVIFSGPTGSGKSTILKSAMEYINYIRNGEAKLRSVEDPVEYLIDNVCQVSVKSERAKAEGKNAFADMLRANLRSAFDVLFVGETRDKETVEVLQQIVESGHQVLTTIHAESSFVIINRMLGLKIDKKALISEGFISALVSQRLIHILSEENRPLTEEEKEKISFMHPLHIEKLRISVGEASGMSLATEVLVPDSSFLDFLEKDEDREARRYYFDPEINFRNLTMEEDGLKKVLYENCCYKSFIRTFGVLKENTYLNLIKKLDKQNLLEKEIKINSFFDENDLYNIIDAENLLEEIKLEDN